MIRRYRRQKAIASAIGALGSMLGLPAATQAYDQHYDYTSFQTGFGQSQFDVLNYASVNGNYMMTSTDAHRSEMTANNNALAEFYNNFLADYNTQYPNLDAVAEADAINTYTVNNSTHNMLPKPNWMILNEISFSVWPDTTQKGADYRQWVIGVATRLHDTYGFNVVTYAPLANPGTAQGADWRALAAKSYIGIENYLSGAEVMSHGTDYASRETWAQAQYQTSKTAYTANGVAFDRLFLGEHMGNTVSGTGYGRGGIAASDWDTVLQIRQDAIRAVGYFGYLAYDWGGNNMGITTAEMIQHEYWYRTRLVLPGQKPQWLADDVVNVNGTTVTLSWNEVLNWIGGVPNANGAEANFFRTIKAARTVTLDGSKTVGTLSFDTPYGYTIAPGTGGNLTLRNLGAGVSVAVAQGNNVISADVVLAENAGFAISAGSLSLGGAVSGTGALTKTGAGTLIFSGNDTHSGGTTISAGTLQIGNGGTTGSTITSTILDNGNLAFNRSDNISYTGVVSGTGSLTKSGTGLLTLLGANTFSGGTTISAGTLQIGNGGTSGSITGNIADNANITFSRSDNITYSGAISGSGSLTQNSGGVLTLLGANSYVGGTTINAGTLQIGIGGTSGSITGNIVDSGNITFNRSDTITYIGSITGTGALTKLGSGTLILGSTSSYSGGTTVSAGTLQIGNGGSGSIAGNILDNANVILNRTLGSMTFPGVISGSGTLSKTGAGAATITGANTFGGGTTISAGTLTAGAPSTLPAGGDVNVSGGALSIGANDQSIDALTLTSGTVSGTGTLSATSIELQSGSCSAILGGTASLTKMTASTVTLSAANTYSGSTAINGGTLKLLGGAAIPNGSAVSLANTAGATLDLNGTSETIGSLAGGGSSGGNVNVGAGTLTTGGNNTSTTYGGVISGAGNLVKNGAGAMTLSGANTYGGSTTINAGILRIANAAAVPSTSSVNLANVAGAQLDLNGNNATIGWLAGGGAAGGDVNLGSATLTTGGNNSSSTFAGAFLGSGNLVKSGNGSMMLLPTRGPGSPALRVGQVTVNGGSIAIAPRGVSGGNHAVYLQDLNLGPAGAETGMLNLNDHDLVISYGTNADSFTTIRGYVFDGYSASVDPSKTGIISSTGQSAGNTILALIDNALVGAADWPLGSGNTIDANSVIGKYTYFGDMDLDGQVTPDDYGILDANFGTTPPPGIAWLSGDADLSGDVTPDDYGILDANLGSGVGNPLAPTGAGAGAGTGTVAVPEPCFVAAIVCGSGLLFRRRRRRPAASCRRIVCMIC